MEMRRKVTRIAGSSSCGTGCGGMFYGLGFIGSAVYYIANATTFLAGLIGLLKAAVWPAFLVFELLRFLGA